MISSDQAEMGGDFPSLSPPARCEAEWADDKSHKETDLQSTAWKGPMLSVKDALGGQEKGQLTPSGEGFHDGCDACSGSEQCMVGTGQEVKGTKIRAKAPRCVVVGRGGGGGGQGEGIRRLQSRGRL